MSYNFLYFFFQFLFLTWLWRNKNPVAHVCNLKFKKRVIFSHIAGLYPQLNSLEDVDFGVLREEEEWSLLSNYILPYPQVVRETLGDLTAPGLHTKIHTHKVNNYSVSTICYYDTI